MRQMLVPLLCSTVLAVGCAAKPSDSLYRPADTTVSQPSTAKLGDEDEQDREDLENSQRAREESLRQQRENAERDDVD